MNKVLNDSQQRIIQWRNNALRNADNVVSSKNYSRAAEFAAQAHAYNDVLDLIRHYL